MNCIKYGRRKCYQDVFMMKFNEYKCKAIKKKKKKKKKKSSVKLEYRNID